MRKSKQIIVHIPMGRTIASNLEVLEVRAVREACVKE